MNIVEHFNNLYGDGFFERFWDYDKNTIDPKTLEFGKFNKRKTRAYFKCGNEEINIMVNKMKKDYHYSHEITIYEFERRCKVTNGKPKCNQCTYSNKDVDVHPYDSFAQYHLYYTDPLFLKKYWDWDKNIVNPWKITPFTKEFVWIKCQDINYHIYDITAANFSNGQRCPFCDSFASHRCHFLDSLAIVYTNVAKMIIADKRNNKTWEDLLNTSCFSRAEKYYFICSYCGTPSEIPLSLYDIIHKYQNNCLKCKDGIKYPNKFMMNLLIDLDVEFKREYSPEWAEGKQYDFYVPSKNLIIEMDGGLGHGYISTFKNEEDAKIDLEVDRRKDYLANKYGLEVVRINCNYDSIIRRFRFIRDNTIDKLKDIFDLNNINWTDISIRSENSNIKIVSDLFNSGIRSTLEGSKILGMNRSVYTDYLKRGRDLGLNDYDEKEGQLAWFNKDKYKIIFPNGDEKLFSKIDDIVEYLSISIEPFKKFRELKEVTNDNYIFTSRYNTTCKNMALRLKPFNNIRIISLLNDKIDIYLNFDYNDKRLE